MIKINRLHAEAKRRLNRVFSDHEAALTTVDLDSYFNHAKEILLENYSAIVEKNRTLSDRMKSLEIKNYKLEKLEENSKSTIFKLPKDHYSTLNRYCYAKAKTCSVSEQVFVNNIQTHKIEESLRDPLNTPSFNWRETFSNEDSKGLHVYHNNVMGIDEVYIDYIKWVPDVAFVSAVKGTYINQEGNAVTKNKHLEIDDPLLWRKIVDIAEYLIKKDFDQNYRATIDSILFNEKVYIN